MMRNKRLAIIVFIIFLFCFLLPVQVEKKNNTSILSNITSYHLLYAQDDANDSSSVQKPAAPANDNQLMKVMIIILIIWIGLAVLLFRLDRKISRLEKDVNEL